MGIFEAIVVFTCLWWLIFLPVLSAGTRSQTESGAVAPGTEGAAPERVNWTLKLMIPTAGATVLTFLLWVAIQMRWLDFMATGG